MKETPCPTTYESCWTVNPKMKVKSSAFSLLAYGKTQIQRWSPNICPATYTDKGTWAFDEDNKVVTIFFAQEWLNELQETQPKEYEKFGSPKKLEWLRFKLIRLSENQMEIEKLTPNKS